MHVGRGAMPTKKGNPNELVVVLAAVEFYKPPNSDT